MNLSSPKPISNNKFTFQATAMKIGSDGFTKFDGNFSTFFQTFCGNETFAIDGPERFCPCFESLVYQKEELIFGTKNFSFRDPVFTSLSTEWHPLIQSPTFGKCQTTNNFGMLDELAGMKIDLNTSHKYTIMLHDPDFFLAAVNPSSVPVLGVSVTLDPNISNSYKYSANFLKSDFHLNPFQLDAIHYG